MGLELTCTVVEIGDLFMIHSHSSCSFCQMGPERRRNLSLTCFHRQNNSSKRYQASEDPLQSFNGGRVSTTTPLKPWETAREAGPWTENFVNGDRDLINGGYISGNRIS